MDEIDLSLEELLTHFNGVKPYEDTTVKSQVLNFNNKYNVKMKVMKRRIKRGDILLDPENNDNIYTVDRIERNGVEFLHVHRWHDGRTFIFDASRSNGWFKIVGNIGHVDMPNGSYKTIKVDIKTI